MGKYIKELYYITHIDSVLSILQRGILSRRIIEKQNVEFTPVYAEDIVSRRSGKQVATGKTLWDYANLYFQARNPMLYRVIHEISLEQIVVLGIRRDIMNTRGTFVTNGNAASSPTIITPYARQTKILTEIADNIQREWWSEEDGSKRTVMAEFLVPEGIPSEYVTTIYTPSIDTCVKIRDEIRRDDVNICPAPDMFFSQQQTLTVSVNCVGVMGEGLASRAKYQFPHVYVYYQDLCKQKKLHLGRPNLYKQELSLDRQLADEPETMKNGRPETWFLLFPTKDNWRNRADIKGIEKGLQWLCDNYHKEGIKSLAMPAVGCGLGWLDWSEVGPLICSYLAQLDISVWLYLPTEKRLPDDLLRKEFLLKKID